jgi:ubiquinone biosynthesis UbiH/UbiF/VisC/COQ6 family hydroxylase
VTVADAQTRIVEAHPSMHSSDLDVAIVGGGLVGLSLACALGGGGMRVALVDRSAPPMAFPFETAALPDSPGDWDVRVYAISPGSQAFLTGCGAWPDTARSAPVDAMQVYGDAECRLTFEAHQARVAHLAHIVENRVLLDALWRRLRQSGAAVLAPAQSQAVAFEQGAAVLTLEDRAPLRARLLVAADGAQSWLRTQAGMPAVTASYEHSAVVANFEVEHAHRNNAFQWFRADGVLALLPLPGSRCSMVWSAQQDVADELMAASAHTLAERVCEASRGVLGRLRQITPPAAFPLQLTRVPRLVRARLALVGDAAHNLHPLAGQGVNLGFQDARELAQVLLQRGACHDVGEIRLLRRYERARREDILAMTWVTHGLQRLFGAPGRPASWVRNRGLSLVDRADPIKQLLVRHALR